MTVMGPKRGDLEPPLELDIADDDETTDLSTVQSWKLLARLRDASTNLFVDTAPTVTIDPATLWKAVVRHQWVAGETDVAGVLLVEVEATWPGGRKQTFPSSGYVMIRIHDDLG